MKKMMTSLVATLCVGVAVGALASEPMTASAAYLPYEIVAIDSAPACVLTLEEAKIKNMSDWKYCRVDDEYDAWYFADVGDGTDQKNPEIRFIADGVQTVTKPYTLIPMDVGSFSFEYCMANDDPRGVLDISTQDYIVQILASDGTYPIIIPKIEADGDWHTITIDSTTKLYPNDGSTFAKYEEMFCGFLFKMGNLDGGFMIKNITLYDPYGYEIYPEEEYPEEEETSSEEVMSSEEEIISSEEESSFAEPELSESVETSTSQDGTSNSIAASATTGEPTGKDKGCGSFGVGAMTLSALAAAGLVLGVGKTKRK